MNKIRVIVILTLSVAFLCLLVAVPAAAGKPMHRAYASGGGLFHAPDKDDVYSLYSFAFDVQLDSSGDATGHFFQTNLSKESILNMDIFYVEFMNDGKTIGVVGVVTKSLNSGAEPGDCRAVLLQDNVKNSEMQKDMRSKLSSKCEPPDFGNTDHFQLHDLDDGHIQIR